MIEKLQEGCTVQPQTKEELVEIIKQTCKEQGWDCDLNFIDTSKITDMSFLFSGNCNKDGNYYGLDNFCGDLSKWNTSNVKNMQDMFSENDVFSAECSDLSNWNVTNVDNFSSMFENCHLSGVDFIPSRSSFKQLTKKWKINSKADVFYMFYESKLVKQHITENLQEGCTMQPQTKEELVAIIKQTCDLKGWNCDLNFIDTSKITDMSFLFSNDDEFGYGLSEFNGDISKWDTSNVTDMSHMFSFADSFNQPIDNWDTSNVENMSHMFNGAVAFNQPINNWNVSKVTDMESMFNCAESFNQPLDNWNISNVTNMEAFLFFAKSFNQDLRNWKINDVCFIDFMFDGTSSLSDTLIPFDLQNDLNINTPNANFNSESNIFIDASKNDPLLNKTNAVYLQADRIWIFPKNELNFENSFVLDKTCYKTFDDVLSCIPMSKSDLGKLFLKNQKTNNCLNKSANYSR